MKRLLLLLLAACMTGTAALNSKTALGGIVKDARSAELLIGATIKVLKNRDLVKQTTTDASGKYRLDLEPGTYDVECAYAGYVTRRITDVVVAADKDNSLNITLETGETLGEVVVFNFNTQMSVTEADDSRKDVATGEESRPVRRMEDKVERSSEPLKKASTSSKPVPKMKAKPATDTSPAAAGAPAPVAMPESSFDNPMKLVYDAIKTDVAEDRVVMPPPGGPTQPTPRAGLLTAGEWNDLHNWNKHWTDLLADGEITSYQTMYGFYPKKRYTVLVTNALDVPVRDAVVQLKSGGALVWEARTDNTGKAELWAGLFSAPGEPEPSGLSAEAWINGQKHEFASLKEAKDGINFLKTRTECYAPKNVDIVWAVDATGSMGDEIEYLKTELLDVINRAKSRNPELAFRMGTVFYRDRDDAYITKSSALSADISKTVDFIKKQYADGGGDYPEAVHSALEEAVWGQQWSENAIARICFLLLDASPHQSPEVNASLQKSIREAARRGIRIVPVTASGIQKDTEFLMKFFGLATNGSYVFLTDHSGIGGKHLEPTTDEYKVEPLNELLVRLIAEYTGIETCDGKSEILFADDPQQPANPGDDWKALYYPNPASTRFTLELPFDVQSVTLYDAEGKAVRKIEKPQGGRHEVLVGDLAAGFYTIRILKDGRMQSGKLMVIKA
jgi:hypothetical protein